MGRENKKWTDEELLYLEEKWGIITLTTIAKNLGRTVGAVRIKAKNLQLGVSKNAQGYLTAMQLSQVCNIDIKVITDNWIARKGLKCKKKATSIEYKYHLIKPKDFWDWAAKNKNLINFSKIERGVLLPEPEWLKLEIKKDYKTIPKRHLEKWTSAEDARLRMLVRTGKSNKEIADLMNRSRSGVEHRISRLAKMNKADLKKINLYWTEEEDRIMIEMEKMGRTDREIAEELGRETLHISDHRRYLRRKGLYQGCKQRKSS